VLNQPAPLHDRQLAASGGYPRRRHQQALAAAFVWEIDALTSKEPDARALSRCGFDELSVRWSQAVNHAPTPRVLVQ